MSKPQKTQPTFDPRLRYEIPAATSFLGYSRAKLYQQIAAGEIRVIRDGRRVYVPGTEIARKCAVDGAA